MYGRNPYLDGYIFAAPDSGEIQGYGMVAKSFSTEFGKPCAWIEDIYIKDSYRGLGIGSRFIEHVKRPMRAVSFVWKWKKKMNGQ